MISRILLGMFLLTLCVAPSFGQERFEIQPFVGFKYGGSIPVQQNDLNLAKISIDTSVNAGVSFTFNATENLGLEFLWNRQPTKATGVLSGGGKYPEKININLDQFHGNLLINFNEEDAPLRPFLLFGLGATRGSGQGSSETKFSFGLGGGIKYFFTKNMGVRLQARYAPTYLYSTAGGLWCNWWGYCWVLSNDKFLSQGDVTAGLVIRF